MPPQTLTADVRQELLQVTVSSPQVLTAEVASLLRYTCSLHLVNGEIVVEAEIEGAATARRLVSAVDELFDITPDPGGVPDDRAADGGHHHLSWSHGGTELSRRTGLIDRGGHPVRGLPPFIIGGTAEQCAAAWRGAFL
ncbi:MAG: DNA-binding protein WhiA, partial [Corynebacterium variabile]